MYVIHNCKSFCCKACNNKSCTSAKIRSTNFSSSIFLNALYNSYISLNLNVGTHSVKLINVFETILKNAFCNNAGSIGNCENSCNLWLHICRITRIWQCSYRCAGKWLIGNHTNCVIKLFYRASCLYKLGTCCFQMLWNNIFHKNITLGSCSSTHKCTCFNLIRDNRIFRSVKLLNSNNSNNICSCTSDVGAHSIQKIGHIYYMWFLSCIFNNSFALSQSCCHHNIDSSSNRNLVHVNMISNQLICLGRNKTKADFHIGSKGLKSLYMQINWTASDYTSSWKCNFSFFKSTKQSSQQIV